MTSRIWIGAITAAFLTVLACQPPAEEPKDEPLARVYNKTLYVSELDGMIPEGTSSEDSLLIIEAYAERWIREALLLYEAENNIPKDLNIDKLVRDYRASLIRHNYEQQLYTNIDSIITEEQLLDFYEKNKPQYQLETPIVRCHFIKVQRPVPESSQVRQWWEESQSDTASFNALVAYCNKYAELHQLEDSTWHEVAEIAEVMPEGTVTPDNIRAKRDFTQRTDNYQYFLRVFEVVNRQEIAPLSYVEGHARRLILRQRREQLLEDIKKDMYDVALRDGNVENLINRE